MSKPTHADVERLLRDVRMDTERLIAFAHGYAQGAQDQATKADFGGREDFRERVRELYRQEYPGAEWTV